MGWERNIQLPSNNVNNVREIIRVKFSKVKCDYDITKENIICFTKYCVPDRNTLENDTELSRWVKENVFVTGP